MKIGVDVDGVLADFSSAFAGRIVATAGKDLFPPKPFEFPCWDWPEHFGYTKREIESALDAIRKDEFFWSGLSGYNDTAAALRLLADRIQAGDDVYFITNRIGATAKKQTEAWLEARFPLLAFPPITVLISKYKGLCASALELDLYIDDKFENCSEVAISGKTKTFLMDRPWNRYTVGTPDLLVDAAPFYSLTRVSSIADMFTDRVVDCVVTPRSSTSSTPQ